MRYWFFWFILASSLLPSCVPPDPNRKSGPVDKVNIDLNNKRLQRIYNFRDRQEIDSLLAYFNEPDATARYLAALSFTTFGDSSIVEPLSKLLKDPVEDVRIAAAFSLGQIGTPNAENKLINSFQSDDSLSQHQRFNAVVLEAIGKCGTINSLKNMASISTYKTTDTLLLLGQCRAIYRFGQRKITDPLATDLMIRYAADEQIPESARLMATHYLARTVDISPDSTQAVVMAAAFVRAIDPDIRMALATALGKSTTGPSFRLLSNALKTESDWRVKCNLINALAKFPYDTVRQLVVPFIADSNQHISKVAASFFIQNGNEKDGDYYWRIARENESLYWQSRVALFHASNKWLSGRSKPESKDFVNYRLREMFLQSQNPYEQAACLRGLAEFPWQYNWIYEKGKLATHPAVKSAAAECIRLICERPNFYAAFGEGARGARKDLYYYLRELIATNDPGIIAEAAPAFLANAPNFITIRDSARVTNWQESLKGLKMPRDIEAYQALEKTIAYFTGQPSSKPTKPSFNHPIEWASYNLYKPDTRAIVQTSKGEFEIRFYPEIAPASVLNFINLAKEGFFDNKTFHRVVPNFVVQDGCPRGDGYGAKDYTIRTEIGPLWYEDEGMVGMASAGFDTESTQWFITHSPTPHLDGRYTLFGRVTKGMNIVHQLQVGDRIAKITIE
ncbi:MAG: peptidylprolyl isomerase [Chitinophagales bacterium]|jgi:cyclophilin family peptidyl-prolyl cis-trans isomerase/HEAT repeat protein